VISEIDKKERIRSEIVQAYGIPLAIPSTYVKYQDTTVKQAHHRG
jgi:hypothetical protein